MQVLGMGGSLEQVELIVKRERLFLWQDHMGGLRSGRKHANPKLVR